MDASPFDTELAEERRARLAAERLLQQKQSELKTANRKLNEHALSLSDQIVDQRRLMQELKGENSQVQQDLADANVKVVEVERLLWNAIESIQDGFALFDKNLNLIAANHPYISVLEGAEHIGPGVHFDSILDVCLDEGLVDLGDKSEDEWYDFMLDRWTHDVIEPVTLRFWNGMYVKLVDRRTNEGGIVSLALNITDSIQREEDLREARDKAQAADRAKSAFLAKMSHELRTPMNGVVGMADLLLENDLDEESQLYVSTIKSSGDALLDIINDVLDFSKIEADRIGLKEEAFDLERIVQEVALIVEPTVQQKRIRLDVDYDQFLPTEFIGDRGRIRQILINLVGNAVKFTNEGHVLIRVVGLPLEDEKIQLHITVEDTGIGIDADKVEHVFGEFNQIEEDANRKYEGTGLGLAITRRLIERMGGEVWIDSIKGEGSSFGFAVPLPIATTREATISALPDSLKTVLLVGPASVNQSVLRRQINLLGCKAEFCESIAALPEILNATNPDVIIAFQGQGFEDLPCVIDRTKEAASDIPIIALVSPADAAKIAEPTRLLTKPIMRSALFDKLLDCATEGNSRRVNDRGSMPVVKKPAKFRVLAAEDNKTNQLVFRKMLKNVEMDLTVVENGREAVDAYEKVDPHMIFMDISMPEMDGMEATAKIRKIERQQGKDPVPICAMTAHAMDGDKERISDYGLDYYLTKPLSRQALTGLISAIKIRTFGPEEDEPVSKEA